MTDLLGDIVWEDLDIDHLLTMSYRDFHAKGLDYVCLHRDPGLTLKAYFFAEGMESQKVGEVINPHDHRYNFRTQCMSGVIRNKWYRIPPCDFELDYSGAQAQGDDGCGTLYNVFDWMTPLNGGSGFNAEPVPLRLQCHRIGDYPAGFQYWMNAEELHTIQVMEAETCIVLAQFEDVIPLDQPTSTFTRASEPPSLKGLYSEFTADELVGRINLLRQLQENL